MNAFNKLHHRKEPPGLEQRIARLLPLALLGATAVPVLLSLLARLTAPETPVDAHKYVSSLDIFAVALGLTGWTAVFTVAIGCAVVYVMKGPAYVADQYDLVDAPRPRADKPGADSA